MPETTDTKPAMPAKPAKPVARKSPMELAQIFDQRFEKHGECKAHTREDCPICVPRWERAGGEIDDDGKARRPEGAPMPDGPDDGDSF